ncbi:MAG: Asp-tRNA(Asn)/Glu-tRNA(Gln) amidotransferase subunit GatC [Alphaproteobacteria bacterium]|nr:Asp-tRNA(Asn)/Glu-tRNA(Gln) amidotransferase subunit GatC [Alphaproteobacteria bacterium]
MAVDNNTVKQVAFLARLKVEDSKVEQTKDEFNKILNWVEQLNEVNTENVEPLVSVNDTTLPLREDDVTDGNLKTEILKNAPMQEFGYFAVPKVVE